MHSCVFIFCVLLNIIFFYYTGTKANPQCGLYGAPPCQFVPAPTGQTPSCARPWKTYCEHVDNYPVNLIKHLIFKLGRDAHNLFVDETTENFNIHHYHNNKNTHLYKNIFMIQEQNYLKNFNGYKYEKPKNYNNNYDSRLLEPIYIPKPAQQDHQILGVTPSQENQNKNTNHDTNLKITQYNTGNWMYRYKRDLEMKNFNQSTDNSIKSIEKLRKKRQTPNKAKLCESSSQYITPKAALNTKGDWIYVLNEVGTARQLVKSETCVSTVCSNICQLPNGYNSQCEQKYIQKRLVALSSTGQNLYTDTFWFPSCCVCTISN